MFKGQLKLTAMSPRIFDHKQKMESEGRSHLTIGVKVLRSKPTMSYVFCLLSVCKLITLHTPYAGTS